MDSKPFAPVPTAHSARCRGRARLFRAMGVFDVLSESAAFIKNGGSQAPQFLFDGGDKFDYGSASLPSCRSAAITCGSMVSTLSAVSEIDSMSLLTSHCGISG